MNAIVTGARTGIGRATVEIYAKNGINVWACAHKKDVAFEQDMESLSLKYGVWIKPRYFDLEDEEEIKSEIKKIISEKESIDILVNNAGIPHGALLTMTTMKELRKVFEINFFSQVLITQMVSRIMIRQKSGIVVNIASVAGLDGDEGYTAYGASKASMAFFTKVASKELAEYGIRVNCIAPGLTETRMMDCMEEGARNSMLYRASLKRAGKVEEIASAIYFLSSESASFITGQVIRVDGGLS